MHSRTVPAVQIAILDAVQLVYDDTMSIQAVQRIGVLAQRLELSHPQREVQVSLALLHELVQLRALPDHVVGFVKDDARLIPFRRGGIDFRASLTVCDQHVQRNPGQHGALAVLPGHHEQGFFEATQAGILMNESEQCCDESLLEQL